MKSFKAFVSAMLLVAFLLPFCTIAASAGGAQQNALGLVGTNGTLRDTQGGVSFSVTGSDPSIYYEFSADDVFLGANSLCFILSNYSLCKNISAEIVYKNGESEMRDIATEQYSTLKTYTVDIPDHGELLGVYLRFKNISSGELIVYSITAIALFSEKIDAIGEISSCEFNGAAVTINGTLRHSSVISHGNAKLSVYALGLGDTVADILSGELRPIISGGALSIRFEFSVPIKSVSDRLKKYVVAVADGDEIHLIDSPRYPSVRAGESDLNFKGVSSSLDFASLETSAGVSVVDVELSELISSRNNGYFYAVDGMKYFFDRATVSALDERVRMLSGSSVQVLLRLCGLETFAGNEAQNMAYAVVHFLCNRYSSLENGEIFGIIMGEKLNESIPEGKDLSQFAMACYDMLHTVLAAADDARNPILAVFPMSESWGERPQKNRVSSDLFIEALFSVCGYYSETRFCVMPETEKNPYGINDDYIKGLGDPSLNGQKLSKSQPDCKYISSDNIARFYRGYEYLCNRYLENMPQVIYSWTPAENTSQSALSAAYVYNYYKLFFARYISSFIVTLDGDASEQMAMLADIKHKIKYIDTEKSLEVGDFARDIFGIADWNDEIVSFKAESLKTRKVKDNLPLTVGVPLTVTGVYDYWNFGEQSSFSGWYSGYGYSSLFVERNGQSGRALTAKSEEVDELSGEYQYIAYRYSEEENFRYDDYLLIELSMSGERGEAFEINVMLGGEGFLYEYRSSGISAGKKYTLCLDISEFTEKNPVEYIKICSKALGEDYGEHKMSIYSLSAASTVYSDEELELLILEERERIHGDSEEKAITVSLAWLTVIVSALAATIIVMIMIGRAKKNARSEERA